MLNLNQKKNKNNCQLSVKSECGYILLLVNIYNKLIQQSASLSTLIVIILAIINCTTLSNYYQLQL